MNTSVTTSQTDVAQFTVVDVGSDWSYTTVTHRLKHKGKNMTIVHKAKMSNKQPPKIKQERSASHEHLPYSANRGPRSAVPDFSYRFHVIGYSRARQRWSRFL